MLDFDCMNNYICRRKVVAIAVAQLNLDRISSSALHGLCRIVEQTDVERYRQGCSVTARLCEVATTELTGDRQRLRRRSTWQNVVCRCHSTRHASNHRETDHVVARVSHGEGNSAFADRRWTSDIRR